MEIMQGRRPAFMDTAALAARLAGYSTVHIDIGTGDGRFVRHLAQGRRDCFVIGLDACRENLREAARRAPANALFIISSAQALPPALHGLAAQLSINFPWGSLMQSLLDDDPALLDGLAAVAQPGAELEVRLNAGALAEAGWPLETGAERVRSVLAASGFAMRPPAAVTARELKACPTTWAKRLAFGRDPRAVYLSGQRGMRAAAARPEEALTGQN